MRIGIDARFLGRTTGIGRYISELFKAMLELSKDEFVLFLRKDNWDEVAPGPRVEKRLADVPWYTLSEQIKLPAIFDGAGCDILHFPHWNVPIRVRTPYVLTIHDLLLLEHPSRRASFLGPVKYAVKYIGYRLVLKKAISRARQIIAPSKFTAGQINRFFHAENKTQVIYEGLSTLPPPAEFKEVSEKGAAKPYLFYVGNAYPHKNLEFLVSAALKIKKGGININLVLVGEDDFYKKLRRSFKEEKSIIFYGRAKDEELASLYKNALAYVFPSLHEGFGLPGLEAMSAGLPVVSAKSGALPEVYAEAAEYFDPRNKKSLEDALIKIINSAPLREELSAKGKEAAGRYKWSEAAKETLRIYNEAINRA